MSPEERKNVPRFPAAAMICISASGRRQALVRDLPHSAAARDALYCSAGTNKQNRKQLERGQSGPCVEKKQPPTYVLCEAEGSPKKRRYESCMIKVCAAESVCS